MSEWIAAAGQAASGIAGGLISNAGNARRQKKQFRQEKQLMEIQQQNQQELNRQGADLQYEMWQKTNYPAQMEMLKDAGLNPGLLYGQSGGGGTTTGSQGGGSAQAGHAPQAIPMDIGSAIQSAMLASTIELQKSQANKNNAEAEKISGTDTEESQTRIASLTQGIENAKAQEAMTKVQTTLNNIEAYEKIQTQDDRLDYIHYQTERAISELELVRNEEWLSRETLQDKKNIIGATAIGAIIDNSLKEQNIAKSKAEINKMAMDIQNKVIELGQGQQRINIDTFESEIKAMYPNVWNVGGRMADEAIRSILNIEKALRGMPQEDYKRSPN